VGKEEDSERGEIRGREIGVVSFSLSVTLLNLSGLEVKVWGGVKKIGKRARPPLSSPLVKT